MKTTIELDASDIRQAVLEYLTKRGYPPAVLSGFGANEFMMKTTWRLSEKWRSPTYIKFTVEKDL